MVRVLREVVADEYVEQVGVAVKVGVGEHDQLALSRAGGQRGGTGEVVLVAGEHGRSDEDGGRLGGCGLGQYGGGGVGVATDEAVEEDGLGIGHRTKVSRGADDTLTTG